MRWLVLLPFLATQSFADEISTEWQGLKLNANLVLAESDSSQPIFLVLHGTWAHSGMEIIEAIQAGFADRGFSSIAPTLSLGESDRTGFRDCSPPFNMRHEHAVDELGVWLDYLQQQGFESIVLLGHSRGGSQVSLFQSEKQSALVKGLVLLGPMVFRDKEPPRDRNKLLQCEDVKVDAEVVSSYHSADPIKHTPDLLKVVGVPAMIFLGEEDQIAIWNEDEISEVRERAEQTVHVIDGADHFFRDLYIDDVLDLVADYSW